MSAETNNHPMVDDELNTTAPHPKPTVWKMPEPVFRRTSGKLPKGFVPEIGDVHSSSSEIRREEQSTAPPEARPFNPIVKLVLLVLAIAAMVAFIVVFLTVLYFFFLRDASAPPPI